MLALMIVSCVVTAVLCAIKMIQWFIGVQPISLFWVCSPLMFVAGIELIFIVLVIAIEVTRAALWKRG
mgnify:CR=1 FL=1